jgi:hypothetical protein
MVLNISSHMKSHDQFLQDRAGAPDSMCLLAQDYLAHARNLGANSQIDWENSELISKGEYPDVLLV